MHLFLLLPFCLVTCYGKDQYDDWIDPTDMLNYDAASGRMHQKWSNIEKTALPEDSDEHAQGTCQSDYLDCKTDTNKWNQKDSKEVFPEKEVNGIKDESLSKEDMEALRKEFEEWRKKGEIPQNTCNPVFRRFLYRIINEANLLGLPDESQPEVHYDAEMVLTKQMVAEFQKFLDDTDWNAGPLDEALGGTLVRFRQHNEEEWSWKFEDYLGIDPYSAFLISLSLLCIVMVVATELWTHISWFTQIKRLFALSFLISLVWNWMYLYRDAFAERQAKLTKIGDDHTCGKKVTWSESLIEWWKSSSSFQNDPCEEYFKALMVNPILLVPPTKAFAVTFTNFITEPLKHIGKGIGEFFHAMLAEMPLFYQPIVLIIIALLLLVFCYGFGTNVYRLNVLRRNHDRERERLPPSNPQREGYGQFIEGEGGRFYNNSQPIQPQPADVYRDALNRRPEVMHPVDFIGDNNSQQEALGLIKHSQKMKKSSNFVETASTTQQPQKVKAPLKRTDDENQDIRDETSVQLQSKDDPIDQSHLSRQPVKKQEDSPPGSPDKWEESVKDSEHKDKISSISRDLSTRTEVKEMLSDVETLHQFIEEVKVRKDSTKEEKEQQLIKDELKVQEANSLLTVNTASKDVFAQGTTLYPLDLYTDPGNVEQS